MRFAADFTITRQRLSFTAQPDKSMPTPRYLFYGLFAIALALAAFFPLVKERYVAHVFWSDAEGYYLYLPATVIYGGFDQVPVRTHDEFAHYPGTNQYFTKYTCGVALMQAPFFLAGHAWASAGGESTTGYERPYINSIRIAGIFYLLLGMWCCGMALSRMGFSATAVMISLLSMLLGTNLLHYTMHQPGMSHIYSFALFGGLLYALPDFYRKPGVERTVFTALLLGLLVLIRPTNLIAVLLVVFYGVEDKASFIERVQFFRLHFGKLLLIPLIAFLLWIPQFCYWHYISGHWLLYSYDKEGFIYWANPQIYNVLFAVKSGWLLFSPMVVIPIIGLLVGAWRNVYESRILLVMLLLSLYLFSSWWCWWFGGSFGHRAFVDLYPLLTVPMAYITQLVLNAKQQLWRLPYLLLLAALIYYSLSMMEHFPGTHYTWESWRQATQACCLPFLE